MKVTICEGDAMRCSVICLSILLCVVCQTRAEVETPDEILFLDSNNVELAKYVVEFTSYYSVEASNMEELYVVDQARDAMYIGLRAISNCKFAYTMAVEILKLPPRDWNEAENLADSLRLSHALSLTFHGFDNLAVNWEALDHAVEKLRNSIALMNRVALVSSARDALKVMIDTRDRLRKYYIDKQKEGDRLSDST